MQFTFKHSSEATLACSLGRGEAGDKELILDSEPKPSSLNVSWAPGLGNENLCFIQRDICSWAILDFESGQTKIQRSQT